MTREEFLKIKNKLKLIYTAFCQEDGQMEIWYEILKPYTFSAVNQAADRYIKTNKFTPLPADILELIPKEKKVPSFQPKFRIVNGEEVPDIQCPLCRDTGLIIREDEEGCRYGVPCDCAAGRDRYPGEMR